MCIILCSELKSGKWMFPRTIYINCHNDTQRLEIEKSVKNPVLKNEQLQAVSPKCQKFILHKLQDTERDRKIRKIS